MPRWRLEPHHRLGRLAGTHRADVVPHTAVATGVACRADLVKQPLRRQPGKLLEPRIDDSRVGIPACGVPVAAARSASHLTTGPGPTDPSRPTRGSSGDSPRSVSTTLPSRRPVPSSVSATSLSPIRASAPRSLAVDVVNSVERRAAPANHQGVQFSVAINRKFTVATNTNGSHQGRPRAPFAPSVAPPVTS